MSSKNSCGIIRFFRSLNCCSPKRISVIITEEETKSTEKIVKKKGKSKNVVPKGVISKYTNSKVACSLSYEREYLNNIEYKDTIAFVPPILYGKVIKVYDGDTITIAARLPFEGSPIYRFSVRLAGIDSPEVKGGSLNETELALKSRDALSLLIFGKVIELKNNGKEKYGRLLADLYLDNLHINKWMIDNMYAVPYGGGKKNRPTEWE